MIKKFILSFLISSSSLFAAPMFEFIKNVDWEFFADNTKFTLDLCQCDIFEDGKGAGFKISIVEPIGIIETTNTPWNIVALNTKFEKSELEVSDLNVDEILLLQDGHCFRDGILNLCKNNSQRDDSKFRIESGSFETLIRLANEGLGITLLPYLHTLELSEKEKTKNT